MSSSSAGNRHHHAILVASLAAAVILGDTTDATAQCAPDPAVAGGTVLCASDDADGFSTLVDDLSIIINDGVTVTGAGSAIATSGNGSTIINNGIATGLGQDGLSISANTGTIINNGTASGRNSGIEGRGTDLVIINNGTALSTNSGNGIFMNAFGGTGTVLNTGTVTGSAAFGDGITIDSGMAVVTNSGTATGLFGFGIDIDRGVVINSGILQGVSGGIEVDRSSAGDATIINSGLIQNTGAGVGGVAIVFQGTGDDLLELRPGSVIIGTVAPGGGTDALTFAGDLDATLTSIGTFETVNASSPLSFSAGVRSGQASTTALGMFDEFLGALAAGLGRSVPPRSPAAGGSGAPTLAFTAGQPSTSAWSAAWGTEASDGDGRVTLGGVMIGAELQSMGPLTGAFLALNEGIIEADRQNGQQIDTRTTALGGHMTTSLAGHAIDAMIAFGHVQFDSTRFVASNTVAGGIERAVAAYDGWFLSGQATTRGTVTLPMGQIATEGTLGYSGLWVNGYSETGSTQNLTIDARDIHILTGRFEISPEMAAAETMFRPYMGLETQLGFGDSGTVSGTIGGFGVSGETEGATGYGAAIVGLDFSHALTRNAALYGGFEGRFNGSGQTGVYGSVGVSFTF